MTQCLSWREMQLFLDRVDVTVVLDYPFLTVLADTARLYVWAHGLFCHSGIPV